MIRIYLVALFGFLVLTEPLKAELWECTPDSGGPSRVTNVYIRQKGITCVALKPRWHTGKTQDYPILKDTYAALEPRKISYTSSQTSEDSRPRKIGLK